MAIQKQNNFPQTYNNKQLAIMSANQNKDNMTSRNIMKQMAAALQQHLRDANIKDVDENSVAKKLQEHLLANVISYLQLTVLKIKPSTSLNQHKQLHAHKEKIDYANSLSEHVASIHDYRSKKNQKNTKYLMFTDNCQVQKNERQLHGRQQFTKQQTGTADTSDCRLTQAFAKARGCFSS